MSGAEFQINPELIFRTGLNNNQIFLGLGLNFQKITLDYAFGLHQELGSSHKITFSYEF